MSILFCWRVEKRVYRKMFYRKMPWTHNSAHKVTLTRLSSAQKEVSVHTEEEGFCTGLYHCEWILTVGISFITRFNTADSKRINSARPTATELGGDP